MTFPARLDATVSSFITNTGSKRGLGNSAEQSPVGVRAGETTELKLDFRTEIENVINRYSGWRGDLRCHPPPCEEVVEERELFS